MECADICQFPPDFPEKWVEKVGVEASCTLALLALHTTGGPAAPSDFPEN